MVHYQTEPKERLLRLRNRIVCKRGPYNDKNVLIGATSAASSTQYPANDCSAQGILDCFPAGRTDSMAGRVARAESVANLDAERILTTGVADRPLPANRTLSPFHRCAPLGEHPHDPFPPDQATARRWPRESLADHDMPLPCNLEAQGLLKARAKVNRLAR